MKLSENISLNAATPNLAAVDIEVIRQDDGAMILRNNIALDARDETLIDVLEAQAARIPNQTFLAERRDGEWFEISYAEFLSQVKTRAALLLEHSQLGPQNPLLIALPNSIELAISIFAAIYIGVPASPVSPAYALMKGASPKLKAVVDVLNPGAAIIGDAKYYTESLPVLQEACPDNIFSFTTGEGVKTFSDLGDISTIAAEAARAKITQDTTCKVLFTSGSTGSPKGVITTHKMLCSNQRSLAQIWPFLTEKPPVLVDWLPWSHVFGGNVCFNAVLFHGGTFYIDDGKPSPALIGKTVENNRELAPTIHFNVPAGLAALVPHLENDIAFAKRFFSRLDAVFVAAAALPQEIRDRIRAAGKKATGNDPLFLAAWGSTETSPYSTSTYYVEDDASSIGLPMPGTDIKLTPEQDKLGLSVRGPNVTAGYWNNQAATKAAFDDDGFYNMGDAGALLDPSDPTKGIRFDGRLSENFKLLSATWVNVGMLRVKLVGRLEPLVTDVVLTGHNEKTLGLLLVPNLAAAGKAFGFSEVPTAEALFNNADFRNAVTKAIMAHNADFPASSTSIKQAALITRLPEIARNEITDKGYINQRAMLANWSDLVTVLHGGDNSLDKDNLIIRL